MPFLYQSKDDIVSSKEGTGDYNVKYVPSHPDAGKFDHDITSPSYKAEINERFDEFSYAK